jgi:hypothetical protein
MWDVWVGTRAEAENAARLLTHKTRRTWCVVPVLAGPMGD